MYFLSVYMPYNNRSMCVDHMTLYMQYHVLCYDAILLSTVMTCTMQVNWSYMTFSTTGGVKTLEGLTKATT